MMDVHAPSLRGNTVGLWLATTLCLALSVIWARSFLRSDWAYVQIAGRCVGVVVGGGQFCLFESAAGEISTLSKRCAVGGETMGQFWLDQSPAPSALSFESYGLVRHAAAMPDVAVFSATTGQGMEMCASVFARTVYMRLWVAVIATLILCLAILRRRRGHSQGTVGFPVLGAAGVGNE